MKWVVKEAAFGDMVRVKIGSVTHYGIFASEDEVIQFGLAPNLRKAIPDDEVAVCASDIDTFRCGKFVEVGVPGFTEKLRRRSPEKTVEAARSRMGEKGYNIITNNCEHFANECMFGKKKSTQTDGIAAKV